ncbi:hypothetical protein KQH21_31290 [Streptomyces sp. IpFD-1.1]|uniref:hypothetical protein n=1 Tax=Streptomyces TaxID=1883 RepID=UPI001C476C67|nr:MULTISPECIES: hypothetical protein [unclassified Streptomyces]MBV7255079.1 hypothetical protein [Streptomyces sp. S-2]MCO6752601.1 hypothetical protein [Streptomyces sp. IpFD-1.1]
MRPTIWTKVVVLDSYGSIWSRSVVNQEEKAIAKVRAEGGLLDEWLVQDPAGLPLRVVRLRDPEFLDTIWAFSGPLTPLPSPSATASEPAPALA